MKGQRLSSMIDKGYQEYGLTETGSKAHIKWIHRMAYCGARLMNISVDIPPDSPICRTCLKLCERWG